MTSWRVKERDWENWERYDQFIEVAERAITKTSRGRTPWHIVEGADENYRSLSVAGTLLNRIQEHMESMADNEDAEKDPKKKAKNASKSLESLSYNPTPEVTILSQLEAERFRTGQLAVGREPDAELEFRDTRSNLNLT